MLTPITNVRGAIRLSGEYGVAGVNEIAAARRK
jgi:hypothetical protein